MIQFLTQGINVEPGDFAYQVSGFQGQCFDGGFWHAAGNPGARILSAGGICEDGMAGLMAGVYFAFSAFIMRAFDRLGPARAADGAEGDTGDDARSEAAWDGAAAMAGSGSGEGPLRPRAMTPIIIARAAWPEGKEWGSDLR